MKLLLVISLIAVSYAAKLDRTYLPPENAGTAGGSPGSLAAPRPSVPNTSQYSLGPSDALDALNRRPGFGQPSVLSGFNAFGTANDGQDVAGAGGSNDFRSPGGAYEQFSAKKQNFGINQPTGSGISQGFNANMQAPNNFQQVYNPERAQAAADRNAEILRYSNENDGEQFSYSFETSNGISAEESGIATNGVRAQGSFSYTGDDGNGYSITYTADENGYVPQGEHLPTPHPIPEEILKSIEENARAAAAGTQEGAYRPEEYENENSPQQYNPTSNLPSFQQNFQAQGQDVSSSQGEAPYSYTRPVPQRPGQQGISTQTKPGSANSFNQQPTFNAQQSQSNQTPIRTTSFGITSNDTPKQISQSTSQLGPNQETQGYNYNRPEANQAPSTNLFGQQVFRPTGFPSGPNTQNFNSQRPTLNTGESSNLGSSPFTQSNKYQQSQNQNVSPNQIGQKNNQFNQIDQNKNSDGYNYDKPQPSRYTPTSSSNKGSFGQTQPQANQGDFSFRPITFDIQKPSLEGGVISDLGPTSQGNNDQQTFGLNRPINPTNKISQSNNQYEQRGQDKNNGYSYNTPQSTQFSRPNANLFGQGSFRPQAVQGQNGIPSKSFSQTSGNQGPSYNIESTPNSGSIPTSQFPLNKNQQSFGSIRPDGFTRQPGQFGQVESNNNPSGYNYDRPQSNQFNPTINSFSQVRPQPTKNQEFSPSKPNSNTYDIGSSNGNIGSSGFGPSSPSNSINEFAANRPINTPPQSGQILGSNTSPQKVSNYMPQNFESSGPSSLSSAITRDPNVAQAPYKYERPSSSTFNKPPSNFSPQGSQTMNSNTGNGVQGKGEQFGGPRQPPSFSAEEGYKY